MFYKLLLALLFSTSFNALAQSSLQDEYIFLKQQLEVLKNRRKETISKLNVIEKDLKKEVFSLETKATELSAKVDTLNTKLSLFDEDRFDKEQQVSKIKSIEYQMMEASKKRGLKADELKKANLNLLTFMENGASVHLTQGEAYDENGIKVKAPVLNFGHVAKFLKLDEKTFKTIVKNKNSENDYFTAGATIDKSIFTNNTKELKLIPVGFTDGQLMKSPTFTEFLKQKFSEGGLIGYVIMLLGLLGLGIAVIRYILIMPYENHHETIEDIVKLLQEGETKKAKGKLETIYSSKITDFIEFLMDNQNEPKEVFESKVIYQITSVQKRVSRFGPYLLVLAGVAPLLGLLGTVTGMIETFSMITVHGTGDPRVLSGGIKAALVTTQFGLIVAIPCILVGNYLSSRASRAVQKFEELASVVPKKEAI